MPTSNPWTDAAYVRTRLRAIAKSLGHKLTEEQLAEDERLMRIVVEIADRHRAVLRELAKS